MKICFFPHIILKFLKIRAQKGMRKSEFMQQATGGKEKCMKTSWKE
jgi:hypothetical protein